MLPGRDATDPGSALSAVREIDERRGRIDVLVNAAGAFKWIGVKTGSGRIIDTGAASAAEAATGMGPYAASKASLLKLTEALAREVHGSGTTVNAVPPTILDTADNRVSMPDANFAQWVEPEARAKMVAFLASPAAQPISGAAIPVGGGSF